MEVSEHHTKPPPSLSTTISNHYFPKQGFITFDVANLDAILGAKFNYLHYVDRSSKTSIPV